ncbi:dihydroxyacetone kinase subunit L [Phyllobacterium brassicacearum]|uniref:Dihydroxyacetone kinase subunit L n=1 Tax=Phyllobacterium brassicacearum TaxID=314235 RepID=A0A2P7BV48_9HYPH|nr:dihydroxyacetone kinase subunit DhaL [Phyllobacterium brassicacearum]PSH70345.1 dihydroxyacetone kinase subunit L [Phyllobacterium brassicacearum]
MLQINRALILGLIETCCEVITSHADDLCELDRAIGDGDHGTNMRRGCEAIYLDRERLGSLPLPQALETIGTMLVMSVGGASGPLYGTLLIEIGRRLGARQNGADFANILGEAIDAVARRGRAQAGDKTLLDVLYPVHTEMIRQSALVRIAERAEKSAQLTAGMKAMRGRASFLGDRSIGHIDPGASSCALLTMAICRYLKEYRPA